MKRTRHTAEQIIRKLRDAEADLAAGLGIGEISRKLRFASTCVTSGLGALGPSEHTGEEKSLTLIAAGT